MKGNFRDMSIEDQAEAVDALPKRWDSRGFNLSDEQVSIIKYALNCGVLQRVLADSYGVSKATINNISTGKSYSHIPAYNPDCGAA